MVGRHAFSIIAVVGELGRGTLNVQFRPAVDHGAPGPDEGAICG